jgi:predicted GTPase
VTRERLEKAAIEALTRWKDTASKMDGGLTIREQAEKFMDDSPEGMERKQRLLVEKGPAEVVKYVQEQIKHMEMLERLNGK